MSDKNSNATPAHAGWDTFWQASEAAAFSSGGLHHPLIAEFWKRYFDRLKESYDRVNIIDLASGSGAVIDHAFAAYGASPPTLTCLDVSRAAINRLVAKHPGVTGIVADANDVPFADRMFDVATSQFGIEYAGHKAIAEICRLVSAKGHIALIMHHRSSPIYRECSKNLEAIQRTLQSNFVALAIDLFDTGFRAVGGDDRAPYESAATALATAVEKIDALLVEFGMDAADGTIAKLYNDVDRIHSNMPRYEPSEILEWLRRTQHELDAYAERMRSMCDSAIDEDTFDRICDELRGEGFAIELASTLKTSVNEAPLAWMLTGNRGPTLLGETLTPTEDTREKVEIWRRLQIEEAVRAVTDAGHYGGPTLEVRQVWSFPMFALICQVREQGVEDQCYWTISGDFPTDILDSRTATTTRDAARHFALKWQLDAARSENDAIVDKAETLYDIVENESAWQKAE